MISEVFKTIRGIKPFFLLVIFYSLSMVVYQEDGALLENPISLNAFMIPFMTLFAYCFAWSWVFLVIRASVILPTDDLANLGFWIACSCMVLALLITLSYVSNNQENINLSILGKSGFIYTCTLYIMSLVAFEVAGN